MNNPLEVGGTGDALVMWCTEGNEDLRDTKGISIIQEALLRYRSAIPPKPIFYAPVDTNYMSGLYLRQPEGITLIAQRERLQDADWQLEEIRRLVTDLRLRTLELIGHLPMCVTMAGQELGQDGITVAARYNDGTVQIFR